MVARIPMLRRWLIGACALITLGSSGGALGLRYECRMTGNVASHCCCAPRRAQVSAADAEHGSVGRECCTRSVQQGVTSVAVRAQEPAPAQAPLALVATRALTFEAREGEPARAWSVACAPPTGPPVYQRVCRYLI